jgi:hypothetical protein
MQARHAGPSYCVTHSSTCMESPRQSRLRRCCRYLLVLLVGLTSTALVLVVSGGYLDEMLTEGISSAPPQVTALQIAGVAHGSGMDPNMQMPGMRGAMQHTQQ